MAMHEARTFLRQAAGFTQEEAEAIIRVSGSGWGILAAKWVLERAQKAKARNASVPFMADALRIFAKGVLSSGCLSANRLRSAMAILGLPLPSEIGGSSGDDHFEIVKFF